MSRHQSIHLDVEDEELLASLSINDEVTVTVRGKIKSISAPRKNEFDEEPETFPGDISIEIEERKIKKGRNAFTEMTEDEED